MKIAEQAAYIAGYILIGIGLGIGIAHLKEPKIKKEARKTERRTR